MACRAVLVAAFLIALLGSCATSSSRLILRQTQAVISARDALDCSGGSEQLHALWDSYDALAIAHLAAKPTSSTQELESALAMIAGPREKDRARHGVVLVRDVGEDRRLLFTTYFCGFFKGGGRLTLLGRGARGWQRLDHLDVAHGLEAYLYTMRTRRDRVLVVEAHLGTQYDRASLRLVDVKGQSLVIRPMGDDRLSWDLTETAGGYRITYETWPTHLVAPDAWAPHPAFEESWDLTGDDVKVSRRSTTPWLEAIDRECDAPRWASIVPCGAWLVSAEPLAGGEAYGIRMDHLEKGPACDPDASWQVEDVVLTVAKDDNEWRVTSARAADSRCSWHLDTVAEVDAR